MTVKPLWGSEWEQDKEKVSLTATARRQAGRAAGDRGLDKHRHACRHSRQIVMDCMRAALFILHWIFKCACLSETDVVKTKVMEMSVWLTTKQLPPLSAYDICCNACEKCGFLSTILSVREARSYWISSVIALSFSSCSFLPLSLMFHSSFAFTQSLSSPASSKKV